MSSGWRLRGLACEGWRARVGLRGLAGREAAHIHVAPAQGKEKRSHKSERGRVGLVGLRVELHALQPLLIGERAGKEGFEKFKPVRRFN